MSVFKQTFASGRSPGRCRPENDVEFLKIYVNKFEISREKRLLSLEEVRGGRSGRYDTLRVGDGAEQLGLSSVDVLEDHDGGDVPAAVAVVWCRPHGHQLLVEHELVAFVDQLVCTADELQVVDVHELKNKI